MPKCTYRGAYAGYENFHVPWWLVVLEGIFDIIIGIFLLSSPVVTTIRLLQILGIFWLAGGIVSIISLLTDRDNSGWKFSQISRHPYRGTGAHISVEPKPLSRFITPLLGVFRSSLF